MSINGAAGLINGRNLVNAIKVKTSNLEIDDLKIGIVPDLHYNEYGGRGDATEIPDAATCINNLDEGITHFNTEFKPDVVIEVGDLIDATDVKSENISESEWRSWQDKVINELDKLDMPWYHVMGNHDYHLANSWGTDYSYPEYGFSTYSDTYYAVEVKGYQIIVLNTCYSTTDFDTNPDDHEILQEQVDWLKTKLRQSNKPKIFCHIPFNRPNGDDPYDTATNQDTVFDLVENDPTVVRVFYGHLHHAESFERIIEDVDGFIQCGVIHMVMDDDTIHNFVDVIVNQTKRGVNTQVSAYYSGTSWKEDWVLGSVLDEIRERELLARRGVEQLWRDLVLYLPFEDPVSAGGVTKDLSRFGNDGTYGSGMASENQIDMKVGKGISLSGVSDENVSVANDSSLDLTDEFTLVAWLYPKSADYFQRAVTRDITASGWIDSPYCFGWINERFRFMIGDGSRQTGR